MKKFRFRFSAVLKDRKVREEEALRALGGAQRDYQLALSEKASIARELESSLVRREGLGAEPTPALAFQLEQEFILGTRQRLTRQEQAIHRASRLVEKALRAYLASRRQSRVMEMLYERHHEQWKREYRKKLQRELDELTVMRARADLLAPGQAGSAGFEGSEGSDASERPENFGAPGSSEGLDGSSWSRGPRWSRPGDEVSR